MARQGVPGWVWMVLVVAHLLLFCWVLGTNSWSFPDSDRYLRAAEHIREHGELYARPWTGAPPQGQAVQEYTIRTVGYPLVVMGWRWGNSGPWALLLFPILDIGTVWSFAVGLSGTLLIVGGIYGPVGAYLPELFATRYRYTGAGMAYNLGALVGGGVTPLVSASLGASFGSYSIGILLACISVASLIATFGLPETRGVDLDGVAKPVRMRRH